MIHPTQIGLKLQHKRNEDNYYVDCPLEHHNKNNTTNYNSSTGKLYCYACRRMLSLNDIIVFTGIEPETYTFNYNKKSLLEEQKIESIYQNCSDDNHEYLLNIRKLTERTINIFDIKCNKDKVLIPIYDSTGQQKELLSLIQRNINNKIRYIQYGKQPVCYPYYETSYDNIILVEGIFTCLRLRQLNFHNVFANVGTFIDIHKLAHYSGRRISVFFDNDTAGNTAAHEIYKNLPFVEIKNCKKDYDLLSDKELMEIFSCSVM